MCFSWAIYAANLAECDPGKCIAVVDVGSTSSKLHIFKQDNNILHETFFKKIKPGIAMLTPNESSINNYLRNLFSEAPNETIPVYFYATAGMRLHPVDKQRLYYDIIEHWFETQSNWQLKSARTISGQEEAVYGWLAVNYKLGHLTSNQQLASVLDMGGASVEIAFPVSETKGIDPNDLYTVHVNNREIVLFARSYLGLGQTLLSQQFLNQESCFSKGYPLPDSQLGKGEANQCREVISKLINNVHKVDTRVQQALQRNPQSLWFTIGGLESIYKDVFFHWDQLNVLNIQSLFDQANESYCHQDWSKLTSQYPNQEYLYALCLTAAYYYSLIVDGYGLSPNASIHIPENENTLDWTMGVLLQAH